MTQESDTSFQAKKEGRGDKTRPTDPLQVSPAGGPLPEIDEGPRPVPMDEIQETLLHAAQEGAPAEVSFDELPEPVPDLDEGPRPVPVDEIQETLFSAAWEGLPTELSFEELPEPGRPAARKVVKFERKEAAPFAPVLTAAEMEVGAVPAVETEPQPAARAVVSEFWLILGIFLSFRFLTLLLLRPGGFLRDWSDFDTYFGIAAFSDYSLLPFLDFWLEWPPLLPWLAVGVYKLSLLLPPWPDDPRFWFITLLGSVFVLFEVGNFVLIYRLARRLFEDTATVSRVLWFYAGLFPPVFAMLGFFDGTALFFMLLGLEFLLSERRFASAVAVGVGFMVKIIPVLLLPVALRHIWHHHQKDKREAGIEVGLYAVGFGLTVLVLLAPFLVGGFEWVKTSARSMVGRSSWETVWAVAEGYYGFGQVVGNRLNVAETNFAIHAGWLPWWLLTILFGGLYAFLISRRADYSRPRPVVALTGLTVTILLLYSKGYSPQFLVYLLPFIVLLFPNGRGLVYALILTGLNVLEQPVYFVLLPTATWLLTFVVIARFLLLVVLAVEFALDLWPVEERYPRLVEARRLVPTFAAGLALLALIVLVPLMLQAYLAGSLAGSSLGSFVGFMQDQARMDSPTPSRLLVSDQSVYRQIYPYLHEDFDVQLVGGAGLSEGAPRIADFLQDQDQVWILPIGEGQETLKGVVAERGQSVADFNFEDLGTVSWYGLQGEAPSFAPLARFSGGIELLTYGVEVKRDKVEVDLYWRARTRQAQSFTVFTQLLDAEGNLVAGHDSIPANGTAPTPGWPVDSVQADTHALDMPAGLPPGEYRLITGLYLSQDPRARLAGFNAGGEALPDQALLLEAIRWP